MIRDIAHAATEAHSHVGQVLLGTAGGGLVFGIAIEEVNKYLQAGAFVVSMFAGICAGVYYLVKIWRGEK
jgi:hypothetical protein